MENKELIYTAQATKIIEMMKFQTRNEVEEKLNYKTWKSLDMYMRRKNFIYDSSQKQYIPWGSNRLRVGSTGCEQVLKEKVVEEADNVEENQEISVVEEDNEGVNDEEEDAA